VKWAVCIRRGHPYRPFLNSIVKPFYANPNLNLLIFGINLDSALNDVGTLLACGVIKKITHDAVTARLSMAKPFKVDPSAPPVLNSKACDENSKFDSDSD
jgi:hypothetical protein